MLPVDRPAVQAAGAAAAAAAPDAPPRRAAGARTAPTGLPGPACAELAFFLLFPGFFAYQTLLGLGMIRAFLGGYFAIVALLMFPLLSLCYLRRLRAHAYRLHAVDAALLGFLAYFAAVMACNAGSADAGILASHVLAIVYILSLFIIFKTLDFESRRFRLTQLASLAAMSAVVFSYSVDGAFYLAVLGAARDPDSVATYQGFSRSYLMPLVVMLACTRQRGLRRALYALGLPTLYINTARSEFGALLFLIPLIEFHAARHRMAMLAGLLLVFLLLKFNLDSILAAVPSNRTLELLDPSSSSSVSARHHLTEQALRSIELHPVLGDYASYAAGNYAHNILSAWVDLGLFGFLGLLALLIYPLGQMAVHGYVLGGRASRDRRFVLAWSMLGVTLLLLSMSHYFSDMLIGAALGAYARYRSGGHDA
ncbi:hypothetical protein SAMN05428959_104428 [Duganella sp. CF517]|uniref:hypothetical protein n=1 Tax=Duganella sp. CF517 TaxID=1881038 RepID=UPI0008AD1C5B|nr:hypothetical protein [Duganella sp. CF517]SEO05835.1 hypothetical protein SAMN05428959_104428 [Duganella sp. CF517]